MSVNEHEMQVINDAFNRYCRDCIHWHKREDDRYRLMTGDCDRIPKGWNGTVDGERYMYDGWSFEDEVYDDIFHCFEQRGDAE